MGALAPLPRGEQGCANGAKNQCGWCGRRLEKPSLGPRLFFAKCAEGEALNFMFSR